MTTASAAFGHLVHLAFEDNPDYTPQEMERIRQEIKLVADALSFRRAPQPAPTAPGWHYAEDPLRDREISPFKVVRDHLGLKVQYEQSFLTLEEFPRWFGPVPQIVEVQ